jgi:benzil reductase ((S)-benzoin forming)
VILLKIIFITGISKGLGASLFSNITKLKDYYVIGVGRNFTDDQLALSRSNENFKIMFCDFGYKPSINLKELDLTKFDEMIFINNAGTIEPIRKVGSLGDFEDIQKHININLTSVIYFINCIISFKKRETPLKILNITSGAAEKPIQGWSLYSSTKKGIKTFLNSLKEESTIIDVHHIDPGVMDTEMQKSIRNSNPKDFPLVNDFRDFYLKGELKTPDQVALSIVEEFLT